MNLRYIYEYIFAFYFPGTTYVDFNILIKKLSTENLGFAQVTFDIVAELISLYKAILC